MEPMYVWKKVAAHAYRMLVHQATLYRVAYQLEEADEKKRDAKRSTYETEDEANKAMDLPPKEGLWWHFFVVPNVLPDPRIERIEKDLLTHAGSNEAHRLFEVYDALTKLRVKSTRIPLGDRIRFAVRAFRGER